MRVRLASQEDMTALAACDFSFLVTREAVPPFEGEWLAHARPVEPYPKSYGFDAAEFASCLQDANKALFVIIGDETPVGYIALSTGWNNLAFVDDLAVDAEWRGTGAAQRLMQQAIQWAREKDLPGLRLETQTNNVAACRFYLRQGFVLGGHDRHLYEGLSPGTRETALFFYRLL
ncbi:GNAT family N-acetyltransferase [Shinella zoogloeoides]|uniref:GNAT family N-acetyltransferase n=1 Tax=Shinella zoogloeoides TaxID=352475 RepID=UPI0019D111CE|nr:GNAT family N-acetyltransferase [Shinella zoogloeoides]UEX80695.1 GNAT family N-acetyltransferase [Shinella zoogloeoides]